MEISKRQIDLEHPLRDLGSHQVPVRLLSDVIPQVTVLIEREGEAAQPASCRLRLSPTTGR